MIVFRNPGLIEIDAIATMGVNVKDNPNAFGFFGTGLKYAIATILRGGGTITIYAGDQTIDFRTRPSMIRKHEFRLVQMDDDGKGFVDMGFTDQLGRGWEPWMVLRELGCNALDEHGSFDHFGNREAIVPAGDEETVIVVEWDALDEAWSQKDGVFCIGQKELMATPQVQVLEGSSRYLFYRGIRAYKLERPSVVTYNILSPQTLTEDRTIAHFYYPMGEIRKMWLAECEDRDLLLQVLAPEGDVFERKINYLETQRDASKLFLDTVLDIRMDKELKGRLVESAHQVLSKHLRSTKSSGVGWASSRFMQDEFSSAIEAIGEIFSEDQLKLDDDLPLVLVEDDEIEDEVMLEDGRIYVTRSVLRKGRREIVAAILPLILEVRLGELMYTKEVADLFVPILMESHPDLRRSHPRLKALDARPQDVEDDEEDDPTGSVADALLTAMDVRGEEVPLRPSEL